MTTAIVVLIGSLIAGPALAGPPSPAPATEIEVVPHFPEGQVRLTLPGREGDQVYVDGWAAGKLPLVTMLAEGPHLFRVDGAAGRLEREVYVKVNPKQVLEIDLSVEPPPSDAGSAPKPAPAKSK